jgi:rfaE bifunctional protein nucleotidyltransferase chain/domain
MFNKRTSIEQKIQTLPALKQSITGWRLKGERVVFTNGCFDLLHRGHISLLLEAAAFGNRLVVAINSDASVKHLKGASRPIQTEADRALLLAAMTYVDAVVIFEEDTPLALIKFLQPDVLVKGGDYTIETVVGAQEVQAYGGSVVLIPLEEGYSTTGLLEKLS